MTAAPAGLEGAVDALFGSRAGLAERYAGHLATSGVERGLIGPREVPRLWDRHLLNCAAVVELLPAGAVLADVGSGAGLPGLALAIARPDLRVTLVEPLLRRTVWLAEVIDDLGLEGVCVHRGRAEDWAGAGFDIVTARAVAPLGRLWGWCLPMLDPGGRLLALKGESAGQELEQAGSELSGVLDADVVRCGAGLLDVATVVVVLTRGGEVLGRPGRGSAGAARRSSRGPRRRR